MDPKQAAILIRLTQDILCQLHTTHVHSESERKQILTHLSRINSTLSTIDKNLVLLEMKK